MNLKNYTTEVQASRSIEMIERLLIEYGAHNIMKQYEKGKCKAVSFIVDIENMKMPFRLPANVDNIAKWLSKKRPNSKEKTIYDQAEKIAWKNQYEMLYLQLGMIEEKQLEPLEVFFPFLYDISKNETYYERLKSGGFKALLPSSTNQ